MSILKSTNIGRSTFEVDLGLSVNWCSCNVGATKPEEGGMYFAWGDTKGYKESEIKEGMFTEEWYETISASNIQGNLDLKYDASHIQLGGNWRMPTEDECRELKLNTEQHFDTLNGVGVLKIISKINSNSIIIPFAGCIIGNRKSTEGRELYIWSSTVNKFFPKNDSIAISGHPLFRMSIDNAFRYIGRNIRPVCTKNNNL